jgi:excisionase family DNA binding protein
VKALSLQDVMARLSVSRKTALLQIARGTLKGYKVGRQWRFDPADVDAFVESQKAAAAPRPSARPSSLPSPAARRSSSSSGSSVKWKGSDRYTH